MKREIEREEWNGTQTQKKRLLLIRRRQKRLTEGHTHVTIDFIGDNRFGRMLAQVELLLLDATNLGCKPGDVVFCEGCKVGGGLVLEGADNVLGVEQVCGNEVNHSGADGDQTNARHKGKEKDLEAEAHQLTSLDKHKVDAMSVVDHTGLLETLGVHTLHCLELGVTHELGTDGVADILVERVDGN